MGLARQLASLRPAVLLLFLTALAAPFFTGSTPVRAVSTIRINFQSEGAELYYRNITLEPLQ